MKLSVFLNSHIRYPQSWKSCLNKCTNTWNQTNWFKSGTYCENAFLESTSEVKWPPCCYVKTMSWRAEGYFSWSVLSRNTFSEHVSASWSITCDLMYRLNLCKHDFIHFGHLMRLLKILEKSHIFMKICDFSKNFKSRIRRPKSSKS